jgi:retinol dehydrogenase-12
MELFGENLKYLFWATIILTLVILKMWLNGPKTHLKSNLTGKIVVITGGSDGIGQTTALQLLKDGATVIFACRNEGKTKKIIKDIKNEDERNRAIFIQLDLSNFSSINKFIELFLSNYDKLDILINNAGAVYNCYTTTEDNIEATLQINVFSHMILTQGLLPLLQKSNGRVVNVGSRSYRNWSKDCSYYQSLNPAIYDFEKSQFFGYSQYAYSKAGNIYFTKYLNEYIQKNNLNVKVAVLHPGTIITEIARDYNTLLLKIGKLLIYPFVWFVTKDLQMGAQTTLHLCYIKDKDFISGGYYRDCAPADLLPHGSSIKNMTSLMELSKGIINHYGKKSNTIFHL